MLSPAVVEIQTSEGLGSGVVYDQSGLIMTNAHVVGSSSTVKVKFSDGSSLDGEVLGADTSADIAVVKVQPKGELTVAKLSADKPQVGETVGAVGSPFGLQGTVTAGIVSALNRSVDGEQGSSGNMIQTDAPINPGNSGGALANVKGEVIGINSAIYSQKGENNGIGFAIPIDTAKTVADKLASGQSSGSGSSQSPKQRSQGGSPRSGTNPGGNSQGGGSASHVVLGVQLKASSDGAVTIAKVAAGSPAESAGLKAGDVIVSIDGNQVASASDVASLVAQHQPGDQVTIEIQRGGRTGSVDVQLATA